jgi:hypothetical protein
MLKSPSLSAALVCLGTLVTAMGAEPMRIAANRCEQTLCVPDGLPSPQLKVLANEPTNGNAGLVLDFDLEALAQSATPLAVLQLGNLEKQPVKRPGAKAAIGRGALHVLAQPSAELAGSAPVKPSNAATSYAIDVTRAVSDALGRPAGQRKLRLEVRMLGAPAYYEIYSVLPGTNKPRPRSKSPRPPTGRTTGRSASSRPRAARSSITKPACPSPRAATRS